MGDDNVQFAQNYPQPAPPAKTCPRLEGRFVRPRGGQCPERLAPHGYAGGVEVSSDDCALNPQNATIPAFTSRKPSGLRVTTHRCNQTGPADSMRMRLMLLGGGNALGQALIRLGCRGRHRLPRAAPARPAAGTPRASPQLLDDTRPDALINLAYYFDWFQAEAVSETASCRAGACGRAACRTVPAPQHHFASAFELSGLRWFARHRLQRKGRAGAARACAVRRCGASNRACAPPARSTCCCVSAGCSMTVPMACLGRFLARAEQRGRNCCWPTTGGVIRRRWTTLPG